MILNAAVIHSRKLIQRLRAILDRIDREHRHPNRMEIHYVLMVMQDIASGRFLTTEDSMLRASAAIKATPEQLTRFRRSHVATMSMEQLRARLDDLASEQASSTPASASASYRAI